MSTELIWEVTSTGSDDTERLGQVLGQQLRPPFLIELRADLGGGKTTFARGLAAGLGSKDTVSSPTFTISKIYNCQNNIQIHHFDFYRLSDPGIIADQLQESINDSNVVVVVEWSDIVKDVLPKNRLSISFSPTVNDPDERQISLSYPESLSATVRAIETDWNEVRP
jgi:tRNA threonylcarbamoyladenosine biosynthesis protein TsaE